MADFSERAKKLGALGVGSFVLAAVFVGFSGATATADVKDLKPSPRVTSRQATIVDNSAVRRDSTWGDVRLADEGVVSANGEVRDSMVAVPGTKSRGFRNGSTRPGMGAW